MSEQIFEFLMKYESAPLALPALRVGPTDIVSLGDGVAMGLHILPVLDSDAAHFASRIHTRQDGKVLKHMSTVAKNYFTTANAGVHEGVHFTVLGAEHIARMACICDRLTEVIQADSDATLKRDDDLILLLQRQKNPTWEEAESVARQFPDTFTNGHPFGGYMIFQDLIRLLWVHEVAHAVLGHTDIWNNYIGENGLPEVDVSRDKVWDTKISDVPWPFALQNFELQADQFAIKYVAYQTLYGWDPAAQIAGPSVDLVQRLTMLGMACAAFAVDTQLAEEASGPRDPVRATHPSAMLRYMNMLHTISEVASGFENPQLATFAEVSIFRAVEQMSQVAPHFHGLLTATPLIAKTPRYKQLCEEQDVLMNKVGAMMQETRAAHAYPPTDGRGEV